MESRKELWKKIVHGFDEKNLMIATMESCTGGGVANEITNVSGASAVIKESYITYCNEAKIGHGVPASVIDEFTVYSRETAIEMARAAKRNAGADWGIGVTGQLGRIDPENPCDGVNQVWFAIADENDEIVAKNVKVSDSERFVQKQEAIDEIADTLEKMMKDR